jgi:hypothetical protein
MRWKIAGAIVSVFAGAQFVQPVSVSQTKQAPVLAGADAPEAVLRIVEKSCSDCHSWNTAWPWYSRISPLSWIMARDVERGRQFLNFSQWPDYSRAQKLAFAAAMASTANQRRMPPGPYLMMHPEARLSDSDRQTLKTWSRSEFRRLSTLRSGNVKASQNRSANGS